MDANAINIAAEQQTFINTHPRTKLTASETISRWLLLKKLKKSLFEPPFIPSGPKGNVRTPSIARWKVRGRLYILHNLTFFAISYGWDVMSGNLSKSAFSEGGGSLWTQISEGKERCPPTTVSVIVAESLPFRTVSKYPQCIIWFYHNPRVWQTDGRTEFVYDAQDRPRICLRGNKKPGCMYTGFTVDWRWLTKNLKWVIITLMVKWTNKAGNHNRINDEQCC